VSLEDQLARLPESVRKITSAYFAEVEVQINQERQTMRDRILAALGEWFEGDDRGANRAEVSRTGRRAKIDGYFNLSDLAAAIERAVKEEKNAG
jgi:hypothetical protein